MVTIVLKDHIQLIELTDMRRAELSLERFCSVNNLANRRCRFRRLPFHTELVAAQK